MEQQVKILLMGESSNNTQTTISTCSAYFGQTVEDIVFLLCSSSIVKIAEGLLCDGV